MREKVERLPIRGAWNHGGCRRSRPVAGVLGKAFHSVADPDHLDALPEESLGGCLEPGDRGFVGGGYLNLVGHVADDARDQTSLGLGQGLWCALGGRGQLAEIVLAAELQLRAR